MNKYYEKLYDEIQELSNKIDNYCWIMKIDEATKQDTLERVRRLEDASRDLSNAAHELEEHLAWD